MQTHTHISEPLLTALHAAVGEKNVLSHPDETAVYDCDGLTMHKSQPAAVVFVHTTQEVSEVIIACQNHGHSYIARGAGTGLSGGTVALNHAVVIELSRMNRILEIHAEDRYAVVEPGVVNLTLTKACTPKQLHYAPDPSSQGACTIGGNVAENAGGPHTLKYGVTVNHILGLEVVLPSGEVLMLGGPTGGNSGYDLVGLFTGCEGTFGIITKVWCRLTANPESVVTLLAAFPSIDAATRAVCGIIADGIIPAALELIDNSIIRAVENWLHLGLPLDAGAVLLIEIDGLRDGLDELTERITAVCRTFDCLNIRSAKDNDERMLQWKARKQAFGAIGRLSPSYYVQDGVIPRTKLPEVLAKIAASGVKHGLKICNVFHAGDGNLHPVILFDERDTKQIQCAMECNHDVMEIVISAGGMLSGEHGIGIEKIEFMNQVYTEDDLEGMRKIRDVFDPKGLCNTGKAIPSRRCFELKKHLPPTAMTSLLNKRAHA
jgi:glycolate oxidase